MHAIVCILALITACTSAETPGSRSCPGGYRHGEKFDSGRYWYECDDGQVTPGGCLSDSGARVKVEETYDTDENRMQCVLGSDGYLAILYKSCVFKGAERVVNDQFDDGQIWYACKKDGNAVRISPIGCVFEGTPIAFGETQASGEYVYKCKKTMAGRPEMAKSGCFRNGRKHSIGEAMEGEKLWYTCTDNGPKPVGCMHNSLRLNDGDLYHENDVIFRCTVNGENTGPVAYGCIQHENGAEQEKKFDCFWVEGDAPYQYEMTCKYDSFRNTALKVQTRCQFKSEQGVFRVEPGCYAKANGLAVGCIRDSSGRLQTRTYPGEKADTNSGLREC